MRPMAKHSPRSRSASARPEGGSAHELPLAGEEPKTTISPPATEAEAIAREMGLTPATLEEVEAEFGPMLPPDDEQ